MKGPQPLTEVDTPDTPTIESLAALLDVEAVADAEVRDVRRGGHDVGRPRARRPRGQRGQAREDRVPREGPAVRRRRLRRARVREGLRGTAGLRRRRARLRRPHGARRERLGHRFRTKSTGTSRARTWAATSGWIAGRTWSSSGRGTAARSTGATLRIARSIVARPHLPAGDEVLRAAGRDDSWTRTGREKPYVMGSYGIGITTDHGGRGRAAPRRRRADLAEGDGAVRGDRRHRDARPRREPSPRPSGSTRELRERGVDVVILTIASNRPA